MRPPVNINAITNDAPKKNRERIGLISWFVHSDTSIPRFAIIGDAAQSVAHRKHIAKPQSGIMLWHPLFLL